MMANNWIEIVGLPGVGKTTLIEKHLAYIKSRRQVVESRRPSFIQRVVAKLYFLLWAKQVFLREVVARSVAYRLSFRSLLKDSAPVLFYDSGVIQLVLETMIEYGQDEGLVRVLNSMKLPSTLLYLTDDLDRIIERELARQARRYPDLTGEELRARYKAAEEMLKTKVFALIPHVHVVDIHNETDFIEKISL